MTSPAGQFIWHELMTTDTDAAARFYGAVVGWATRPNGLNDKPYTVFTRGDCGVAGMMAMPADGKAPPCWMGTVQVADVDAILAKAVALGGQVYHPAEDIPNVGRFGVIGDPHGAGLVVMTPAPAMPAGRLAASETGAVGWNELMAGELESSFAFYAALFGWEKLTAVDMGPMGIYQVFGLGGERLGGMMTRPPMLPVAFWQYYMRVANIDAAKTRLEQAGGKLLNGPMEVPGGEWIIQAQDAQGVFFNLVGAKA